MPCLTCLPDTCQSTPLPAPPVVPLGEMYFEYTRIGTSQCTSPVPVAVGCGAGPSSGLMLSMVSRRSLERTCSFVLSYCCVWLQYLQLRFRGLLVNLACMEWLYEAFLGDFQHFHQQAFSDFKLVLLYELVRDAWGRRLAALA